MRLVDTHAHLDDEKFAGDLDAVIERARAAGVEAVVAVGTTAESSEKTVELARRYALVYAAVGVHPNDAGQAREGDWERVVEMVGREKVVAIGETGLDRHWDYTPREVQREWFGRHLELARRTGLAVIMHSRDAEAEVVEMVRSVVAGAGAVRGVMHSFTGSAAVAGAALKLGLYVSFAGMVTYKKSEAVREVARGVPLDRLLVETDCPYLAPQVVRGKRNEPAYVRYTAECLAEVKGVSVEELARVTTENARRLFGLKSES